MAPAPDEKRDLRSLFDDVPSYRQIAAAVRLYGSSTDPVSVPNPGHAFRRGGYSFRHEDGTLIIESADGE